MKDEAIGIAINGREVKIAHINREKDKLSVDFLESSIFSKDIDAEIKKKSEQSPEIPVADDNEDVFAVKNPYDKKSPLEKESSYRENVDVLYSILTKFAARKIKVGFNIAPSRVTYQDLDTDLDYNKNLFKSTFKKKIESWKQGFNAIDNVSVITRRDGTLCNVACETQQPPILDILEQLNSYFKGNLFLSLMDSNEVSLVNLARTCYDFRDPSEITVIVQVETEYSRIIFMKGDDLLSVSPIINESFNPDIISIVYSKIIYELDNSNIPEIGNILLAGRASSVTAKNFFEKKFPDARVGFIISQPMAENLSTQFSREELSNYAIPIALAWKLVDAKNGHFIPTNLLSSQVIDRQKVLTLSLHGYAILLLLGISAFILTWKITAKKIEVGQLRKNSYTLQERINSSEETVKRVHEIEDEIVKLTQRIVLSDSLSNGSNRLLTFLEKLNESVSIIKSIWIEEVQNTGNGILIKGKSVKRGDVPRIAEELGGTKIRKLTRAGNGSRRLYAFEMEVDWKQEPFQPRFKDPLQLENVPPLRTASTESTAVSSKSIDWGTSTTATRTVIAEQDAATNEMDENFILNQQAENELVYSDKEKVDRLSNNEATSSELQIQNELKTGSEDRIKSPAIENAIAALNQEHPITEPGSNNASNTNTNSHFTIKISAHASQFTAKKEVSFYRGKGFDTYITTLPNSSREIPYWVCLGDFPSYDDAQQELIRLNSKVPGRRIIIEISKDGVRNYGNPALSMNSSESIINENSRESKLIKKANLSVVSQGNQPEKEQFANAAGSKYYTIRISAHVINFTANKEVQLFKKKGYQAYVTRLRNSSRDIPYSVCYGKFASYNEAQNEMNKLKKTIPRSYDIVPINN